MHILYVRPYPGELELVQRAFPHDTVTATDDVMSLSDEECAAVDVVSVFVDYVLTKDVLDRLRHCQLIATRSAGYDHVDLAVAKERSMTVTRVPHYGTQTVAEYTLALMFALSRNAFRSYTDLLTRTKTPDLAAYEGFDLAGKTLGVIGTGSIGRAVAQKAAALAMEVLAYDVTPDTTVAAFPNVRYATLEALLQSSHIVTVHVPSLPQTHHLMNEERFALMREGSYFINTARGDVVDTHALVGALERGHLKGAALDVLEGEHELQEEVELLRSGGVDSSLWQQLVENHVLIDMPNVIVTPHIAFNTVEAKREITDGTIANIKAWSINQPQHTV